MQFLDPRNDFAFKKEIEPEFYEACKAIYSMTCAEFHAYEDALMRATDKVQMLKAAHRKGREEGRHDSQKPD